MMKQAVIGQAIRRYPEVTPVRASQDNATDVAPVEHQLSHSGSKPDHLWITGMMGPELDSMPTAGLRPRLRTLCSVRRHELHLVLLLDIIIWCRAGQGIHGQGLFVHGQTIAQGAMIFTGLHGRYSGGGLGCPPFAPPILPSFVKKSRVLHFFQKGNRISVPQ